MELSSKFAQANLLQHNALGDFNSHDQNSNSRHMGLGPDNFKNLVLTINFPSDSHTPPTIV